MKKFLEFLNEKYMTVNDLLDYEDGEDDSEESCKKKKKKKTAKLDKGNLVKYLQQVNSVQ